MIHVLRAAPFAFAMTLGLAATSAAAQETPPDEDGAKGSGGIGDIVVTAQRRSERTQDVPASISAFGADELARQNVTGIETLARRTPGFYLGSSGALRPALYIRGVGSRQADAGSEAPVGVFLDDIYLGRSSSALGTLKDIERVEILRGPQGTLYGRNTIGGAVNILSKAPTSEFEGRIDAGVSTYGGWNAMIAAGGPVDDAGSIRARFAAWRDKRDGYITNLTNGRDVLGTDNLGARARLDIDLSERITLSGIADYSYDGDGAGFQGKRVGNVVNRNAVFLGRAGLLPQTSPDRFGEFYNSDPTLDRTIYGFTGKLVADLGGVELSSISGYRGIDSVDGRDVDASSLLVGTQLSTERSKQFTQEIRLASVSGGPLTFADHLSWLVGAYYYHDSSFRSDQFDFGPDSVIGLLPGAKTSIASADYTTKSYAFFGQFVVKPVDGLELTLGARYSHDKKTALARGTNTIPGAPLIAVPYATNLLEESWSSFDPKAVLAYHLNSRINVYASYSKGFKSGGFQYVPLSEAQARLIYDPEELEAFEIGFKSRLFDDRVQLNLSAYKYNYNDLQVTRNIPQPNNSVAVLVTNAGTSKIKGADVELIWKPVNELELGATYNYLDAKYTDYIFAPAGIPASPSTDFSGTRLTRSPKHSLSGYGELTIPGPGEGELILRADYAYRTTFFFEPGEGNILYGPTVPFTVQEAYGLLDLRATYRTGNFSISAFADNVTNEYYLRNTQGFGSVIVQFPGSPRVIGAQLGYRW
jgi:iron complex outermembrane receptor protein